MLRVSCPGCGAPAEFKSHASVMAVCAYCRTIVLKDPGAVRELGKLSEVLEDYSPIQIGTAGQFGGRGFSVIGRIQLRYASGLWNEWFLQFDDGGNGWLGDSSSRYVLTVAREAGGTAPAFDMIRVGRAHDIATGPGVVGRFIAAEKRVARCIGGQGELPFRVGDGWEARVADFRRALDFLTLDYSDGPQPVLYLGAAVTLSGLRCQLLRDDETILASAGRYRGRVTSLSCPHCGTSIGYLPGMTANIVCQSCQTRLDASSPAVQVLTTGEAAGQHAFTLPPGSTGSINGRDIRVLGAMRRVDDEGTPWNEYLLYDPGVGFSWLVETDEGWWRAEGLDDFPELALGGAGNPPAQLGRVTYRHLYGYTARVELALGAFNWKVAAGDSVHVDEYEDAGARLAAELTREELTWSRSTRIAFDQVRTWFALAPNAVSTPAAARRATSPKRSNFDQSLRFLLWIGGLNLVPLIVHFRGVAPWLLFGAIALVLPAAFFDNE